MSKPVSTAEIEDVLSSIRALVSSEKKPANAENTDQPALDERLVLTPALRVREVEQDEDDSADFDSAASDAADDSAELHEIVSETVTEVAEDAADDTASEEAAEHAREIEAFNRAVVEEAPLDFSAVADEPIVEWEEPAIADAGDEELTSLSDKAAAMETALGQDGDWEPDGSEPDTHTPDAVPEFSRRFTATDVGLHVVSNDTDTEQEEAQVEAEDVSEIADPEIAEAETQEETAETSAEETLPEPPVMLSDPIAFPGDGEEQVPDTPDVEEVVREIAGEEILSEVVAAEFGDPAGAEITDEEVIHAFSATEEVAPEASASDFEDAEPAEALTPDSSNDALEIPGMSHDDVDALREMVRDVVRAELQGAMGEKITRNMRKMVRREIHRALAAQDFE